MNKKDVFLLEKGDSIEFEHGSGVYSEQRGMNVKNIDGLEYPLVSLEGNLGTNSKTCAAPGDDDPDPDDERCY